MVLTGRRVLIVEDDALIAMLVETFLQRIGCVVAATASRLDDAVGKARTLPLDLAVLDINLAGELSYPVAEVLQQRWIPFVFATGYGAAGVPESLNRAIVVSKPFRTEQLATALLAAQAAGTRNSLS
jgi:CheY-like chemotaxis protein